jgi:hypothetical protein
LKLHPWELKRYTLRELLYRIDEATKRRNEELEIIQKSSQVEWERARWLAANFAGAMGSKIQSVYSIAVFPWESPPPEPTEDLLSMFPKTLN